MSIEEKKKKGGKLKWIIIVIVLIAIIGTVAGEGRPLADVFDDLERSPK